MSFFELFFFFSLCPSEPSFLTIFFSHTEPNLKEKRYQTNADANDATHQGMEQIVVMIIAVMYY